MLSDTAEETTSDRDGSRVTASHEGEDAVHELRVGRGQFHHLVASSPLSLIGKTCKQTCPTKCLHFYKKIIRTQSEPR
jgi:hypothetical protein